MTEKQLAAREEQARVAWVRHAQVLDNSVALWEETAVRCPKMLEAFYPALYKLYWWMSLYSKEEE
jgi:hypothetical protein